MVWVYDLEQFPNFHLGIFINRDTNEMKQFIISDTRNDIQEYKTFLLSDIILVGFNNLSYDYSLIHEIITRNPTAAKLYEISQNRIEEKIYAIPEYQHKVKQIDLYKIMHFDNDAKRTSLKALEFAMRMENIIDMPFPHYHIVEEHEIEEIIKYCINDVEATARFLKLAGNKAIKFRVETEQTHGIKVLNANDIKLGVELFAKELANEMGIDKKQLEQLRTQRESINLGECVLSYIKFKSPNFSALLNWIKSQEITETKGAFSFISLEKCSELIPYIAKTENEYKDGTVKSVSLIVDGKLKKLNIVYKGFQYDFGTGGIHGCIAPGIYESDKEHIIVDVDVASYYPNIAIVNELYPEHLSKTFCKVYKGLYEERKQYSKSDGRNGMIKLALNGAFGKSNSKHSFLYDPKFTMSITVNGQLLLVKLAEDIVDTLDCTMLQANTDGLTVKIKRKDYDKLMTICKEWEHMSSLTLEYVNYKQMVIRDVKSLRLNLVNSGKPLKGNPDPSLLTNRKEQRLSKPHIINMEGSRVHQFDGNARQLLT
jgi:hypothetical protein